MIEDAELLAFFQELYREALGSRRDVRRGDRLADDLAMDSLLVTELLVAVEDRYDLRLLHEQRLLKVKTVGDLLDLVRTLEAEQRAATPAGSAT
jgi:acyl carrier protein